MHIYTIFVLTLDFVCIFDLAWKQPQHLHLRQHRRARAAYMPFAACFPFSCSFNFQFMLLELFYKWKRCLSILLKTIFFSFCNSNETKIRWKLFIQTVNKQNEINRMLFYNIIIDLLFFLLHLFPRNWDSARVSFFAMLHLFFFIFCLIADRNRKKIEEKINKISNQVSSREMSMQKSHICRLKIFNLKSEFILQIFCAGHWLLWMFV